MRGERVTKSGLTVCQIVLEGKFGGGWPGHGLFPIDVC